MYETLQENYHEQISFNLILNLIILNTIFDFYRIVHFTETLIFRSWVDDYFLPIYVNTD